jgi:hypothetical protein
LATLKSNPSFKQIIASLRAAHETPYSALSSVLFTQPLPPLQGIWSRNCAQAVIAIEKSRK